MSSARGSEAAEFVPEVLHKQKVADAASFESDSRRAQHSTSTRRTSIIAIRIPPVTIDTFGGLFGRGRESYVASHTCWRSRFFTNAPPLPRNGIVLGRPSTYSGLTPAADLHNGPAKDPPVAFAGRRTRIRPGAKRCRADVLLILWLRYRQMTYTAACVLTPATDDSRECWRRTASRLNDRSDTADAPNGRRNRRPDAVHRVSREGRRDSDYKWIRLFRS